MLNTNIFSNYTKSYVIAYSGSFTPKNKNKYHGDVNGIKYRSSWELSVMRYCDMNPDIIAWNSEEIVIPYICKTDNRPHRYYIDMAIKFKSGKTVLVEIKPNHQTKPPKQTKNKKRFLKESMTYAKNISKWEAATKYAKRKDVEFQIWDENTLRAMGIRILTK